MTESEMSTIMKFAKGQRAFRDEAIAVYRKHLHGWINAGNPKCPYMGFMREIDNHCSDLGLRAHYRAALIELGLDEDGQ